jgi:hypothetical protein
MAAPSAPPTRVEPTSAAATRLVRTKLMRVPSDGTGPERSDPLLTLGSEFVKDLLAACELAGNPIPRPPGLSPYLVYGGGGIAEQPCRGCCAGKVCGSAGGLMKAGENPAAIQRPGHIYGRKEGCPGRRRQHCPRAVHG